MNYNWNWPIFFAPAPNGTGTYLDMLLSGLVLTIETALVAWIIALVTGSIMGVFRSLPSKTANSASTSSSSRSDPSPSLRAQRLAFPVRWRFAA